MHFPSSLTAFICLIGVLAGGSGLVSAATLSLKEDCRNLLLGEYLRSEQGEKFKESLTPLILKRLDLAGAVQRLETQLSRTDWISPAAIALQNKNTNLVYQKTEKAIEQEKLAETKKQLRETMSFFDYYFPFFSGSSSEMFSIIDVNYRLKMIRKWERLNAKIIEKNTAQAEEADAKFRYEQGWLKSETQDELEALEAQIHTLIRDELSKNLPFVQRLVEIADGYSKILDELAILEKQLEIAGRAVGVALAWEKADHLVGGTLSAVRSKDRIREAIVEVTKLNQQFKKIGQVLKNHQGQFKNESFSLSGSFAPIAELNSELSDLDFQFDFIFGDRLFDPLSDQLVNDLQGAFDAVLANSERANSLRPEITKLKEQIDEQVKTLIQVVRESYDFS